MQAAELIKTLGHRIGIPDLALSNENTCSVIFDDDEVIFEVNENRLFMIAEIGILSGTEEIYKTLLSANYLGQGTGFGSLGLNINKDEVALTKVLDLDCDYEYQKFEDQVALFVKVLRYWKDYLRNGSISTGSNQDLSMVGRSV